MKEEKRKILFDKFCEKVNVVNPNLVFDIDDWIPNQKKIKGYCNLHNKEFHMLRTELRFTKNCNNCNKHFTNEQMNHILEEFVRIESKYEKIIFDYQQQILDEVKTLDIKQIPKCIKNAVWNKYVGQDKGVTECPICRESITWQTYECGHIIAKSKGGETILENLIPICGPCNKSIGNKNVEEFKRQYGLNGGNRLLIDLEEYKKAEEGILLDFSNKNTVNTKQEKTIAELDKYFEEIPAKNRVYEKYVEKMILFNENLYIDIKNWNHDGATQFTCYCKIHGGPIYIYKQRCKFIHNCQKCNIKYDEEKLKELYKKCDEIDEKYKKSKFADNGEKIDNLKHEELSKSTETTIKDNVCEKRILAENSVVIFNGTEHKKYSVYFFRFKIRMLIVNPNIEFKADDWITKKNKIEGFCKLHNTSFSMYKGVDMMVYNCPLCNSMKKISKEEKESLISKLKNLEFDEYKDIITNGLLAVNNNIVIK